MSIGERLKEARGSVVALLDGLEVALDAPVLDAAELARNRWALARALIAMDLLRQRDAGPPLGEEWRAFVTRWAGGLGAQDQAYRAEARRLAADLRRRLR